MGKASRWLVNFLLGRKEDHKGKRKQISNNSMSYEEGGGSVMSTPCGTPLVVSKAPFKRRWSFGKLQGSKERSAAHKSSRSLDSITATPLVKQAMGIMAGDTKRRTKPTNYAVRVEAAAATRIQAAFRSYLAKKALQAWRGLVKLQALVRGHLVRKQTTATLRSMHALMAIQVRARFKRIQMAADEPQFAVKSQPSKHGRFPQEMRFKRAHHEAVDINLYENHGIMKRRNGFMNHSQIERVEQGITRYCYSGELKVSKREQKYEEFSFTTHNSPRQSPPMSKPTPGRSSFSSHEYHPYDPYMPSYMANTESSRAKFRSQSEPKQRPTTRNNFKAKGQRTASAEEMEDDDSVQQHCSADENQEPWFVKLYQSTRTGKENKEDTSGPSSYSEYRKSLVTSEPHATLF